MNPSRSQYLPRPSISSTQPHLYTRGRQSHPPLFLLRHISVYMILTTLNSLKEWQEKKKMNANDQKCRNITFTLKLLELCSPNLLQADCTSLQWTLYDSVKTCPTSFMLIKIPNLNIKILFYTVLLNILNFASYNG